MIATRHPGQLWTFLFLVLGGLCPGLSVTAAALERVTLHNGFSYDCSRHEQLDDRHIRLFLAQTGGSPAMQAGVQNSAAQVPGNYVDLPASEVATVELLPDPPVAAAHSASTAATPDLRTILSSAGGTHDIDVELLASIVHAESGGRAGAVSRTGAVGLMQLMPSTALALGVADARRPEQNINGGTAYLDSLLVRYHNNLALALAAYNAGPGAVDRYHGIPPFRETRAYVVRVMQEFKRRKEQLAAAALLPGGSLLAKRTSVAAVGPAAH